MAVLTNVVFPSNGSDDIRVIGLTYLVLFFLLVVGGYFFSKKSKKFKDGMVAGMVIAVIAFGMTMLTFIVIDNLFLSIVSQQADKIWAFSHQTTYHNMRDYINSNNLSGLIFGTLMAAVTGSLLGVIGAAVRKIPQPFVIKITVSSIGIRQNCWIK